MLPRQGVTLFRGDARLGQSNIKNKKKNKKSFISPAMGTFAKLQ